MKKNNMQSIIVMLAAVLLPYGMYGQTFNGYAIDEIQAIHAEFDSIKHPNKGGDYTRYISTHTSLPPLDFTCSSSFADDGCTPFAVVRCFSPTAHVQKLSGNGC